MCVISAYRLGLLGARSIYVHSTLTKQPTSSAQNGLEEQMDMPHLRARGMYLLAQLQSFYQSLAPFPKLWLIYLDLCSCSNSRRLKLPCYPKSDFYFFLAFKIFFYIRIFFFKILHTIS